MCDILISPEFGSLRNRGTLTEDVDCVSHAGLVVAVSHFLETQTGVAIMLLLSLTEKQWPVQLFEVLEWNELQFLLFALDMRRTLNIEENTFWSCTAIKARPSCLKDVQLQLLLLSRLDIVASCTTPPLPPSPPSRASAVAAFTRFQRLNKDSSVFSDAQGRLQIAGCSGISRRRWKDASPLRSARIQDAESSASTGS